MFFNHSFFTGSFSTGVKNKSMAPKSAIYCSNLDIFPNSQSAHLLNGLTPTSLACGDKLTDIKHLEECWAERRRSVNVSC